jgi:subtilase family serine protease
MIRKFSTSLLAAVLMTSVMSLFCSAQSQTLLTRHVRGVVSNGEAPIVGLLPANKVLHFDVVLALRHAPELENFLRDIYDPSSPNYRHFLTPKQFTARFGPSQQEYDAVIQFAKANGFHVIRGLRDGRDVQLSGTVAAIEQAFHVTMGLYRDAKENRTFFAIDREPTVDLPFQLWHISGLDNYSVPKAQVTHHDAVATPNITGSCPGNTYCASDMRAAYYGTGSLTGSGQNLGLLEFLGTNLSDLSLYYTNVHQTEPYTPTLLSTGGYSTSCTGSCDDTEQTIDMTQAMGMAPGSTMLYMYVCGDSTSFSETDCFSAMVTDQAAPLSLQLSSSWLWSPADPTTDDPFFEQMAAQGQTFFNAAGDDSAWVSGGFAYPAEDDNVICVGGTEVITNGAGGPWESETTWPDGGGGISPDGIAIPSWQQLAGVITSQNEGSTTLRNGPDVSAEANFDFYACHNGGCEGGWGGTSFATPMWAGYLALANEQAVQNGAPAPGFIDPTIYPLGLGSGYGTDFHDITSGSNGFPAVTGYDLATGWGSPNGPGLIDALTGPPGPSFSLTPSPSTLTILPGNQGTSTIAVAALNGFSGTVALTVSGCPANTTCTLSPSSVTVPPSENSTLTVQTTSSTAGGTYPLTITGTSGKLTITTSVSLIIPNFSISATPASTTLAAGGSTTYLATVSPVNGFSGAVGLTVSGCPTNSTCTLSSTSVTLPPAQNSTLTVQTASSTPSGTYSVTITGTSGSTVHSTSVTLVVKTADFSLTSGTSLVRVNPGESAGYGLTLTPLLGFTGKVSLGLSGLPASSSKKFSPNPVAVTYPTTSDSVLTVTTTTSTPVGTYTLKILGVSGSLRHSVTVTLVVAAP